MTGGAMNVDRLPDWQKRLNQYLIEVSGQPFNYGTLDCVQFVAGAVEAMTGRAPEFDVLQYDTLRQGVQQVRAAGFRDHVEFLDHHFGPVIPLMAWPGDIAVMEKRALGIVQGRGVYVLSRPSGLGLVPLSDAVRAYRVPI